MLIFIIHNSMYIEWTLDDIKNAHVIVLRGSVRWTRIRSAPFEYILNPFWMPLWLDPLGYNAYPQRGYHYHPKTDHIVPEYENAHWSSWGRKIFRCDRSPHECCRPGSFRNKRLCKTKKKGLEEHYQLLIELTPREHKLTCLDIEVDVLVKNSSAVSSWNNQNTRSFWL